MLWVLSLFIITALLAVPQTHQVFVRWTKSYPYWMGFVKFAILASIGELLALRLAHHAWKLPIGLIYKVIVWGLIGMMITFMFSFYSTGVSAMVERGIINTGKGFLSTIYRAFLTSLIMNLTFGIVFMALHRLSDTYIELRINEQKPSLNELIQTIQWDGFISFVVFKTIPIFWIPAHTITFTLPEHLRVVAAAYLSIMLGAILVYAKMDPRKP